MLIYGASGHGQELGNLARICGYTVLAYVDDALKRADILTQEEALQQFPEAPVLLGAGYPLIRRKMAKKAERFVSKLIHPRVEIAGSVKIDEGSVVQAGCVLTVNIQIGRHTHINIGSTINHDVQIGDFVTLSPGVHLCGNVIVGSDVFIGAGAVLIQGRPGEPLVIGQGAMIGAGAVVTKSVPAGQTWVGVPARPL